jgi:predicted nucleic acid-binding Zn ribbon protein
VPDLANPTVTGLPCEGNAIRERSRRICSSRCSSLLARGSRRVAFVMLDAAAVVRVALAHAG